MEVNEDMLQAAAAWWADKLKSCKFDTLGSTRQDPQNRQVEMAEILAQMSKPQVSDEQTAHFHQSLVEGLRAALAGRRALCVGVDYHPDVLVG
jgi:hypothetical protein